MNLAEWAIKKKVVTWALTLVMLVVGLMSYQNLSRLEDPAFTIKNAVVVTPYPGASAEEVEKEVTDKLEIWLQELGQLWWVESTSMRGVSTIKVRIKDQYDADVLPQVWDELRRKVSEAQRDLPPGAGPSSVNDDFGDVYGVYLVLTGDGYSDVQLREVAKFLRRELLLVQDVKRIVLWGEQNETIYVEMSREKMAALGISQQDIYDALASKNLVVNAGKVKVGPEFLTINPTGEFESEQEFGELMIRGSDSDRLVRLRDVAEVRRDYVDPPRAIARYDGQQGVAMGISTVADGNVVTMGEALAEKMHRLRNQIPLGIEFKIISLQSDAVTTAISGFVVSLLQAIAIVIGVLMLFMGLTSAVIIGGILFLTVSGTFLFMNFQQITLERISLGALIIALGMLVDNAIVVIDGMKVKIEQGMDKVQAATEVVGQNSTPLLGATIVAITAFASIGTSEDGTGEYCRSLFSVIMISLLLSWVTAVTTTPLVGVMFLKKGKSRPGEEPKDPYGGKVFQAYKALLMSAIRRRWLTLAAILGLFVAAVLGFGLVPNQFFPDSTRPQFFVDVYFPEGTHIRDTERGMMLAEEYLMGTEGVTGVGTVMGGGDIRFLLTYEPQTASSATGTLFADVEDFKLIGELAPQVQEDLAELLPMATVNTRLFRLGPGDGGRIQLRISGDDPVKLREMGEVAMKILREAGAQGVRSDWREKVKVIRPQMAEAQARRLGIDRPELAQALLAAYEGERAGVYRESDELIPIVARAPEQERVNLDHIEGLQIWSPTAGRMIPMRQVLTGFSTEYEDARIWRRDRVSTFRVHGDAPYGVLPSDIFARVKPEVEKALRIDVDGYLGRLAQEDPFEEHNANTIPIKPQDQIPLAGEPGYFIAWGGEPEDAARAQGALAESIPAFVGLMVLIVLMLFNSVRLTAIIWLTVPLSIIGVTLGLLVFRQPFGFMALLGLMSLSGMLIKNSIVLIEEINHQVGAGKETFWAIVDSGLARARPVVMAAATTILGLVPLLGDAFFVAMAVTIMVGLGVATILTLIVVPVLYAVFFRVLYRGDERSQASG